MMLVEALGLLAILFSIVSIRERRAFWASRPRWVLAAALAGDACVGLAIAMFGVGELQPLPLGPTVLIVGYSLVCSLGPNDVLKSMLITRLGTPTATAVGACRL